MSKRCNGCDWKYPDNLLAPIFLNGEYAYDICGICALVLVNETHGTNNTKFNGKMAEANRLAAIKWREDHPNDAGEKIQIIKEL